MRNIKRVMSLVMAGALSLSMVAGAVTFPDSDKITTTNAVDMLYTLGIIKGCSDGTFQPQREITKGEFAKIVYVIKNGGKDDGATYYKDSINVFNDTKGHWAEGYINYAYSLGIVSGNGKGQFEPNKSVSGLEAAKMLLTVLGYDAQKAGLVGSQWNVKTAALGTEKGLFDNYSLSLSTGSTREYAAQLAYNSLFAPVVKLTDGSYVDVEINGSVQTLGEKQMGLQVVEGILEASGDHKISGTVAGAGSKKQVIKLDDGTLKAFSFDSDLTNLLGQRVRVVVNAKENKVFGVYSEDNNKTITIGEGKVEVKSNKLYIDGKEVKLETGAQVFVGNAAGVDILTHFATKKNSGVEVTFISNDEDDAIELAIAQDLKIGKITGVYKSTIGTDITGHTSINLEDIEIYDDAVTGDNIELLQNLYTNKTTVKKMGEVIGKVSATRSDSVMIDGVWYTLSDYASANNITLPALNEEVSIVIKGEYIYNYESIKTVAKDVAYVTGVQAGTTGDINGNFESKLLFADGSVKVIKTAAKPTVGDFVTYTIKDEVYTLTNVDASNLAGFKAYDNGSTGFVKATKKVGNNFIADDALVFVEYVENSETKHKTMSGKAVNALSADFGLSYVALTEEQNGFNYAKILVLKGDSNIPGISGENNYGYLTETPYNTIKDDVKYVSYKIWNGKEEIEVMAEGSTAVGTKGDYVTYNKLENDMINSVSIVSATDAAVTGYNSNGDIKFDKDSKDYRISENTKIIYVDSQDNMGLESGTIRIADRNASSTDYINNVSFKAAANATNGYYEIELIVVDVNNEMK